MRCVNSSMERSPKTRLGATSSTHKAALPLFVQSSYSVSPAASRASSRVQYSWPRTIFPSRSRRNLVGLRQQRGVGREHGLGVVPSRCRARLGRLALCVWCEREPPSRSPRLYASMSRRATSTFSSGIPYSNSPAASRASSLLKYWLIRRILSPSNRSTCTIVTSNGTPPP